MPLIIVLLFETRPRQVLMIGVHAIIFSPLSVTWVLKNEKKREDIGRWQPCSKKCFYFLYYYTCRMNRLLFYALQLFWILLIILLYLYFTVQYTLRYNSAAAHRIDECDKLYFNLIMDLWKLYERCTWDVHAWVYESNYVYKNKYNIS